jgi:hypothetical protein
MQPNRDKVPGGSHQTTYQANTTIKKTILITGGFQGIWQDLGGSVFKTRKPDSCDGPFARQQIDIGFKFNK